MTPPIDGADRDQPDDLPVDVGEQHEEHPGDPVDQGREDVLGAVEALEGLVDADAEHRHHQHALGGAEVAAVDAAREHPPATPTRPRGRAARRSPRAGGRPYAEMRGPAITRSRPSRISAGTTTSKAAGAGRAAARRPGVPRAPRRWPGAAGGALAAELAAVADRPGQRSRHQPDRVGDVGRHRRDAEGEQRRERDQRPRPHHGVDGAGRHAREGDQHGFDPGHAGAAPGRSGRPARRRRVRRLGGDRRGGPAQRVGRHARGGPAGRAADSAAAIASSTALLASLSSASADALMPPCGSVGPMSTRVRGVGVAGDAGDLVDRRAEALHRLGDLAGDDPHLVGVALGDLRHHLEVLVGQQRLVRAAVVDGLEDRLDGLALTLRPQDLGLPVGLGAQDLGLPVTLRR